MYTLTVRLYSRHDADSSWLVRYATEEEAVAAGEELAAHYTGAAVVRWTVTAGDSPMAGGVTADVSPDVYDRNPQRCAPWRADR